LVVFSTMVSLSTKAQTLEAHYEFSNNLNDATANGRNLTKSGSAASYAADKDSNANSAFDANDATGEYLTATGYKGIGADGARTVAAWVYLRAGGTRKTVAAWGTNTAGTMFNVMIEGGVIRVEAGTSSLKSAGTVSDETWTHIAVTYDPTDGATLADCKMYINGAITSQGSAFNGTRVINTDSATNDVRIGGAIYSGSYFYRGVMDDVRIYSGALTGSAIATLAGVSATTPVANFSASSTTPATDNIITFTDSSTNTPTSWSWDFGASDAVGITTDQNPQVSYPTAGTYTVTLTATNAGGSDDEIKTSYITVSGSGGSGDLQARYNFDGDTNDSSSYSRNLSATGSFSPTYENDHNASASSALTASGTYADHLITGYPGIGSNNNRSVTAWFKTAGASREPIVSFGDNSAGKMFNVMIDNGVPRIEGGASSLLTTDSGLNDNSWHHIAVTYDSADGNFLSNVKVYIDGVLSTNETDAGASYLSETQTIQTDVTKNFLKIGSAVYTTSSYTFDGAIDDVRIYSKALTSTEVTSAKDGATLLSLTNNQISNKALCYPNPAKDLLTIKSTFSSNTRVELYTILGSKIQPTIIERNDNLVQLDINKLTSGIYTVVIINDNNSENFTFIKK
ncbi:LamG-like jellyroll fold domain-containing protein, partial [Bacteroidota bacterium]